MDGIWTNRNALGDFVQNGLTQQESSVSNIYVAVAFFTDEQTVQNLLLNDCHLRLIVRLGFPTSPYALRKLIAAKNIEIRYFTGAGFHPKLYIFGDRVALIGSANLTKAALISNQEIVTSIESDDPRFDELQALFSEYWAEASVLTPESLEAYEVICNKFGKARKEIADIDKETEKAVGKTEFSNIDRGKRKKSKENIFFDAYSKTFQECVTAFNNIRSVYDSLGQRKNDFHEIPIRLEIDSFLSWVREKHAIGETWLERPIGWTSDSKSLVYKHAKEWLKTPWQHYDQTVCHINYPLITTTFGLVGVINEASFDDISNALVVLHSFHDRLRFYKGGLPTLLKAFKKNNEEKRVKASVSHLLFGEGNEVRRMADLIHDPAYKLSEFGQSNVQELTGWLNNEDLPVVNGRTTKVFRYYGFDVRQL